MITQEELGQQIEKAVELLDQGYPHAMIARAMKQDVRRVRRMLMTAGRYSTPQTERVRMLREDGKGTKEIADIMGVSQATVVAYTPFSIGEYTYTPKTGNALTEPTIGSQAPSTDVIPPELISRAEEMSLDPAMLARAILLDWLKKNS